MRIVWGWAERRPGVIDVRPRVQSDGIRALGVPRLHVVGRQCMARTMAWKLPMTCLPRLLGLVASRLVAPVDSEILAFV